MFVLHTLDIYYMIPYIYFENEMPHCLFPNHTIDNKKTSYHLQPQNVQS